MSYEPRTIAFLSELIYQPLQLRTDICQGVHNALFKRPEIAYQNFRIAQDGVHLENLPQVPGAVSSLTLLPDRILIREEMRGTTVEDFATRLVNVATVALRALGVANCLAQQFVIRSLITPHGTSNATDYMARQVLAPNEAGWATLQQPVSGLGLRMTFPLQEPQQGAFHLRIETWHQDPRSLWIENVGSFTRPTPTENMPDLATGLYASYRFVTNQAIPFLESFGRSG